MIEQWMHCRKIASHCTHREMVLLVFTWNKTTWSWHCVVTYRSFVVIFFDVFAKDIFTCLNNCRLFDWWQTHVVHAEVKLIYWWTGDQHPWRRTSLDVLYPVVDDGFFTSDKFVTPKSTLELLRLHDLQFSEGDGWALRPRRSVSSAVVPVNSVILRWIYSALIYLLTASYEQHSLSTLVQ
jgi:hypothetical protein